MAQPSPTRPACADPDQSSRKPTYSEELCKLRFVKMSVFFGYTVQIPKQKP